jgi:glyoxylase-like metal-dependent hydrolase (beta-lactamase superfamily II)
VVVVLSGVHRVDGVNANIYIVNYTDDEKLLIDTGMPRSLKKIERYLSQIDVKPSDLKMAILTHCHIDHVGCAAQLGGRFGIKILIGEQDSPYVTGERRFPPPKGLAGVGFRLFGAVLSFESFKPDGRLKDGDNIGKLKIIHTPGHTPGSICVFDTETGTLFSGDTLLSSKGELKPPSPSFSLNHREAIGSLEKIMGLNVENLCPGHGEPLLSDVSKKLRLAYGKWKNS